MDDTLPVPVNGFVRYCPKCGHRLWIDESRLDGYNRYDGEPYYFARVWCSNYRGLFSGHYHETVNRLTRGEYNRMAHELLRKP